MSMLEQLRDDLKGAMRSGDAARKTTIRSLIADIENARIAKEGELAPADEIAAVAKALKQREDSAAEYARHGRDDLAENEFAEAEIIKGYMPEPATPEEIAEAVRDAASGLEIDGMRSMGRLVSAARSHPSLAGKSVDGKSVADAAKAYILAM